MYKKRLTALLLAVCMLCSLCVTARAVDDTTALETIRTLGIMKGDEDGSIRSMRQLSSVTLTELGSLSAMAGSQEYTLDENVQVILRSSGSSGYYETTLSAINAEDYTLKGWYDNLGYSAGGRIRIIVATEK